MARNWKRETKRHASGIPFPCAPRNLCKGDGCGEQRIFDADILLNKLGGDWKLTGDVTLFLIEQAALLLVELRNAILRGDENLVEQAVHELRIVAANAGSRKIVDESSRIQQAVRKGDMERSFIGLDTIDLMLARFRNELAEWNGTWRT